MDGLMPFNASNQITTHSLQLAPLLGEADDEQPHCPGRDGAWALCPLPILHVVNVFQLLSCVQLFATPFAAARQASLSFTVSQ